MTIEPIFNARQAQNTASNELASKARSFITNAAIMASIKNNEKRLKNGSLLIANSLLRGGGNGFKLTFIYFLLASLCHTHA